MTVLKATKDKNKKSQEKLGDEIITK